MNTTCPVLTDALLDRLRALSASFCLAEGGSHGPDHSERVLQTALTLGRRMGARLEILAPAALLHDIGRREESQSRGRICHADRGAELAAPLLPELGYSVAEVAAICHCIRAHRYRGATEPARSKRGSCSTLTSSIPSARSVSAAPFSLPARSAPACTIRKPTRPAPGPIRWRTPPTGNSG